MSVLVVGVSHNSAPMSVLERVALGEEGPGKLIAAATALPHVAEVAVVATCNRVEIYAEVARFHGSVESLSRLLLDRAEPAAAHDPSPDSLSHLYVHYDDGAVSHLFQVAAGLDSMAVGEAQILGQAREALRVAQEAGSAGSSLNTLFQQALRVGKRARAETGIDRVAPTLVSAALDRAVPQTVEGRTVLVLGAGAMAGLSVATVTRQGAGRVVVANRTADRADRLAREYGAVPVTLADLPTELSRADVVIACTGATGAIIDAGMVAAARAAGSGPLAMIDLALPHDIAPEVSDIADVTLLDLAAISASLDDEAAAAEVEQVRGIVSQEVTAFLAARRQASVTPTVVALRSMATAVVDSEMERLEGRLGALDLDPATLAEVRHTVRRVADKLLHEPTVRVKELADDEGAVSYAAALAELFSLDPDTVEAVTRADGL